MLKVLQYKNERDTRVVFMPDVWKTWSTQEISTTRIGHYLGISLGK